MTTAWPSTPPQPPPPRPGAPRWVIALIAAVTALVVGAGVFVTLTLVSGTANADEVTREPVNTAGANPFMPSVGTDAPDVASPTANGGTFRGDTPGLYGGTRDNRTCDAAKLTGFLDSHPGQAAAWASVLNVRTTEIDSYVSTLTPVLLRSDTQVTNHGYVNGRATVVNSVLQAGTAVFVDRYGAPVVRCYCGNPLTAPTLVTSPVYVGPTWVSFNQTNITVVQNTTTVVNDYTLVDPWKNRPFNRTGGYDHGWTPKNDDGEYGATLPSTGTGNTDPNDPNQPPDGTRPGGDNAQAGADQPGGDSRQGTDTGATPVDPTQAATCPDGSKAGSDVAQTATADLTRDGKQDAAVLVKCGQQDQVQVIDSAGQVLDTLTPQSVPNSPQMPEFRSISLSGDTLTATMGVFGADDTTTPTETQHWTYTWTGSSFTLSPSSVQAVEPATPTTGPSGSVAPNPVAPNPVAPNPVAPNLVAPDTSTTAPPTSTTSSSSTGG